ncbi:D-2-hydroxyglutarate dehydrogenase YdiJ [Cellvibrio japonicus]|uniref:D-2-hydroxyglutarate dehydrogenase n=1 Tax=Cellvibrio japonicus (strain Ueda107) TaxID=498211 RepID=B3PLH9_CELJU|nr:FAD-binding and (Fe-S)-binding domain-containing protein [Cellvibrio japonicus]ACE82774.1 putative oxidoreductase, FAD-binding [Cellvibrio japonicus Ueda107]QEI12968.1 FAD-binding oxidoreductase [Cellvibrio japonicus]QEI16542.1 FAD-binding oxidoreductase [Cellvibrio japonicus]QEI20120.1 FAD-binding oxidoreductase [Cellvibrio japonicus]
MIPRIDQTSPVQALYLRFIEALRTSGFSGDLNPDYANRTVLATDNSIYQVLPQGVLYPRHTEDLVTITQLSQQAEFHSIVLSPRGGGTGTNGQSLTDGLVVDTSKYMNQILELNVEERWVRVQCGVVKDQLNAAIQPHGLFFAPELSTSNRATIGGMINTDASGQGSCRYGKTRDHVLELTTVLLDGSVWTSRAIDEGELESLWRRADRVGEVHRIIDAIQREHHALIRQKFPRLNRCLTGYDLAHIRDHEGRFNLNNILCGSEGTLGFITEAKINLLPIPKCSALINVNYRDFNAALRDATALMKANPTSIETVDSKVLNLAMNDIVWHSVSEFFPAPESEEKIQGINLVEYTADSEEALRDEIKRLTDLLDQQASQAETGRISYSLAWGSSAVNKIWGMRKKAVGLLGNVEGEIRPVPFVEDTAVPPENLADFILEFRAILDEHQLMYGMFGHVDAGVLHVRPALDMKDPQQEKMVRVITDKVVALTQKYNGLLWGEHGKGVRSEYAPAFFGELYPQIQRIKAAFDPRNQLNPGKIATPAANIELLKIDGVPTRGQQDRKIPLQVWEGYSEGVHCNGNGLCYNWNPNDAMCPSWKGTRERKHSPKGRASLMREWLKQMSERGVNPIAESKKLKRASFLFSLPSRVLNTLGKRRGDYDFSHEVHESMMGCLACKSCVGQCPIKVDVPEFRAKFLELYYSRYLRPFKDYFIGGLEYMIPTLAKLPWLYNLTMKPQFMQTFMARVIGMVDSPLLTGISLHKATEKLGVPYATLENIAQLSAEEKARAVILVQDAFTSYFETALVIDTLSLLKKLGFVPLLAPFKPNGKPLQVHGFLKAFAKAADTNATQLNGLASSGISLVGIEPAMTLAYRAEYKKVLGDNAPKVLLLQEWLARQNDILAHKKADFRKADFSLLAHCTEKTNAVSSIKDWQSVFSTLGQSLKVIDTGCCGMAGTYGHETTNLDTSKKIYALSWSQVVNEPANAGKLTATGYSCRSQAKRIDQVKLPHPVQVLLQQSL